MASDYYDDSTEEKSASKPEKDDGEATALLPTDFFPHPPEVGKVCRIKVQKIFDDQVSVAYVADKEKEKESAATEDDEEMASANSDVDELMA